MVFFSSLYIFIIAALKPLTAKSNSSVFSKAVSVYMVPTCLFLCMSHNFLFANYIFPLYQLWRLILTGSRACCHSCLFICSVTWPNQFGKLYFPLTVQPLMSFLIGCSFGIHNVTLTSPSQGNFKFNCKYLVTNIFRKFTM